VNRRLVGRDVNGSTRVEVVLGTVEPGGVAERHTHEVEQAMYVLDGRALVEVDGERLPGEAALAIVANVPTYRGFLNLTPLASPLDGLLDVFCVPRTTKLRLVSLLFAALLRPPSGRGPAISRRARRVWLEVEGRASEELTVLPGALPVLVPAGWPNDGAPRRQRRSAADGPASRRPR